MATGGARRTEIATVSLEIKTSVDVTDNGYLGPQASVSDHMKAAIEEVGRWSWYVDKRKGTTEQYDSVGVRVEVLAVTIVPKEKT